MKRNIVAHVVLFMVALSVTPSQATNLDVSQFTDLRMGYAKSSEYDPTWDISDSRNDIITYLHSEAEKGLKLAERWLEKYPFDAEILLLCSSILHDMGKYKDSIRYRYAYHGLLASIISINDGLSEQSPIKVISVGEEYVLLNYFKATIKEQALITSPTGIPCDKILCEIGGKTMAFYFDVSLSVNFYKTMFKENK